MSERVPLAGYTSFRIGGPADLVVMPKGWEDLVVLSQALAEERCDFLVLGRGTNLLVSDAGFRGVAVVLTRGMKRLRIKSEGEVYVECGCDLNRLILWCMEHRLAGLEELSGIPGSVGGAVRMNAGAHGLCIGDRVDTVKILRLVDGEVKERKINAREAEFGYRKAAGIDDLDIIYEVKLKLYFEDKKKIAERREEFLAWRRDRQPLDKPSAGSVFLNPPSMSAGEVIERCGLKGLRVGDAAVSTKHANFIVNMGKATAKDVRELIRRVKEEVVRREGIELQEEIRMVGFSGEETG